MIKYNFVLANKHGKLTDWLTNLTNCLVLYSDFYIMSIIDQHIQTHNKFVIHDMIPHCSYPVVLSGVAAARYKNHGFYLLFK